MTVRKKAKWGYRKKYLLGDDGIRVFSERAVKKLAKDFGLPEGVPINGFQHRLEMAALAYRTWLQNADLAPRRGEIKTALSEIAELSERLQKCLDDLDDDSAKHFGRPEMALHNAMLLAPDRISATEITETTTEYGHRITWQPITNGHALIYLGGEHFAPALKLIHVYATSAIANLPNDAGGRKRSEGLRYWVINIENIWTQLFGKAFTFDQHKGEPVTEAARFAVAAMAIADSTVATTDVRAAFRAYIRELRPGRGRKNPTKKTP